MATITVCDECGEEIEHVKITVSDNVTGDTEDVCSAKCMKAAVDRQDRHARQAEG